MTTCKHGCDVLDSRVFWETFYKSNEYFLPVYIASSKYLGVGRILETYAITVWNSPNLLVFRWSYGKHGKKSTLLLRCLTTVFRDLVARATIACQTLVFSAQVTSRSKVNHFSSWMALNHFGICSDSFKLRSNIYLSLGPKRYGKKGW